MAAPVKHFVLVEAGNPSGGSLTHIDPPTVRFDRTLDPVDEHDNVLIIWPRDDGSITFTVGPDYELAHDNTRGFSVRRKQT